MSLPFYNVMSYLAHEQAAYDFMLEQWVKIEHIVVIVVV